jgi:hypothetical protein
MEKASLFSRVREKLSGYLEDAQSGVHITTT